MIDKNKIRTILLADTMGGGNLQLRNFTEAMRGIGLDAEILTLFSSPPRKRIKFSVLRQLLTSKDTNFVFSDPVVGLILSIFCRSKCTKIRYSQGDDFSLYSQNRNIPRIFRPLLNELIKFDILKSSSSIVGNSEYVRRIYNGRELSCNLTLLPLVQMENKRNKPLLTSLQAPGNTKNFSFFCHLYEHFKESYDFLVISKEGFETPKGMGILVPESREILFSILSSSFAHISTSKIDSFGLPIYEAMSLGIPSIVFNNQSFHINERESIENLLFLEQNDLDGLSNILSKLLSNQKFKSKVISDQYKILEKYNKHHYIDNVKQITNILN
jgi:glycosyltransferase involved in cell wall biosynthesis